MLRDRIKWLLFPGLNLHARLRNRVLPEQFREVPAGDPPRVLDAGCGNGMLAYASFRRGNQVLGVSIKDREIRGNSRLFGEMLGIPTDRLRFEAQNLYALDVEPGLSEIICTEVLEHISDDAAVAKTFYDLLAPGGVLHLCCPNAEHPDNVEHDIDDDEAGGHVRNGYTEATYRALLEPIGFRIETVVGLGGPLRQALNRWITGAQRFGLLGGLLVFALISPLLLLPAQRHPKVPYSLYVRAVKGAEGDEGTETA